MSLKTRAILSVITAIALFAFVYCAMSELQSSELTKLSGSEGKGEIKYNLIIGVSILGGLFWFIPLLKK